MGEIDNATWQALGLTLTVLGLAASVLVWRRRGVSAGLPVLAPLLGFVVGFWFQFRRNRVRPAIP